MKYFLVGILIIVSMVIGGLVGTFMEYKVMNIKRSQEADSQKQQYEKLLNEKNAVMQDFSRKFTDLAGRIETTQEELTKLKEAVRLKEAQLEEAKSARLAAEQKAATIAQPVEETKPKQPEKKQKPNILANAIKTQIEQVYRKRINKLNEKSPLSDYQKAEMDKLLAKEIDRIVEMTTKLMAGELTMEELTKNDEYKKDLFDEGIKELLTQQQLETYNVIQEEERKEQMNQLAKMYINGSMGFKGINEVVNLNDEQKQQIQGLLEEKLKSAKSGSPVAVNSPAMPFDDKEFTEKVRATLTPEQQPKFDEYLKTQEELKKMIDGFIPKGNQQSNPQ